MAQETRNYNRFWMLIHEARALFVEDKEEVKKEMVLNATNGRTDSLKELTQKEYDELCDAIESRLKKPYRTYNSLKRARSAVLHQMQLLGINTADWSAVDRFCQNNRIAGKRFCKLTEEELQAVYIKCLMIHKKQEDSGSPAQARCKIISINSQNT